VKHVATALAGVLLLAACAGPTEPPTGVSVVAVTSVYGDLAMAITGDLAAVTSLIGDPAIDPHSFEASARDQLAIADADLVIENGGGYDPFMDSLIDASGSGALVVSAVEEAGLAGSNEHVWYSLEGTARVVGAITAALGAVDPQHAAEYDANASALVAEIAALESRAAGIESGPAGGGVVMTEPVPAYLLESVGLDDLTPGDFTEAIEEQSDVPPLALQDTLDLLDAGEVTLLAYNPQTASPETERVRAAAEAAGIPVVLFTETLPEGQHYVTWMTANLDALEAALRS
jgi:zinc/manganese transport system substrate-binding protein